MSSGETVPRSVPTPSPGSAVMSELGLGVAALLAPPAGAGLLPEADRAEELETAAFPEAASPPATALELGRTAWLGTHGAWGAGEAKQAEEAVVVTLVEVASAASGSLCPCVDAA
jgi:hypothetical protein